MNFARTVSYFLPLAMLALIVVASHRIQQTPVTSRSPETPAFLDLIGPLASGQTLVIHLTYANGHVAAMESQPLHNGISRVRFYLFPSPLKQILITGTDLPDSLQSEIRDSRNRVIATPRLLPFSSQTIAVEGLPTEMLMPGPPKP